MLQPKDRIIVALDVSDVHEAITLVEMLRAYVGGFKIGFEFFIAMFVQLIVAKDEEEANFKLRKIRHLFALLDGKLFLDLKLNDIPNTVGKASKAISALLTKMFNMHASAGPEAMKAAAANKGDSLLLAVTVLTSLEPATVRSIFGDFPTDKVLQFARQAMNAGLDGIVCSPQEIMPIRAETELASLKLVTPGIRDADAKPDDQKQTMTAAEAIIAGADYLVIGRPITTAPNPVEAVKKFIKEIGDTLNT